MDNSVRYNHQVKRSTGEATVNMWRGAELDYMKDLSVYLVKPTCCKAWEYRTRAHEHKSKRFEKGRYMLQQKRWSIDFILGMIRHSASVISYFSMEIRSVKQYPYAISPFMNSAFRLVVQNNNFKDYST